MANANVARGLLPVRFMSGAPYNGACRVYYVPSTDSTALYKGDPVKTVNDASDAQGIQTVTRAAAGDKCIGVMMGVITAGEPPITVTRDTPVYRTASVNGYVLVADDPNLLFEAQEDSVGGVMTVGCVGRNVEFIVGTGSTSSGFSGTMLDSSTYGTGATLSLRILEPVKRADNDPTLDYAKWLVRINLHQMNTLLGV